MLFEKVAAGAWRDWRQIRRHCQADFHSSWPFARSISGGAPTGGPITINNNVGQTIVNQAASKSAVLLRMPIEAEDPASFVNDSRSNSEPDKVIVTAR